MELGQCGLTYGDDNSIATALCGTISLIPLLIHTTFYVLMIYQHLVDDPRTCSLVGGPHQAPVHHNHIIKTIKPDALAVVMHDGSTGLKPTSITIAKLERLCWMHRLLKNTGGLAWAW